MAWFAIYRLSDGGLISEATGNAEPSGWKSPAGLAFKDMGSRRPDGEWNPATLVFSARILTLTRREQLKALSAFTTAERDEALRELL